MERQIPPILLPTVQKASSSESDLFVREINMQLSMINTLLENYSVIPSVA